jgi:signal transduction histidine kinase
MCSYFFLCVLSIGESWTDEKINILLLFLEWLMMTFLNYYLELKEKKLFYVKESTKLDLKMRKDLINHIKSGIIILNENNVDFNTKAKDMLELTNDFLSDYQKIQYFVIGGFLEVNENLEDNIKSLFKEEYYDVDDDQLNNVILTLKQSQKFKEFTYIGTKILYNEKYDYEKEEHNLIMDRPEFFTIRIKMRYNSLSQSLEIYMNDISSIVEMQDLNASNKYKKMFLNKFSHEFKNPLLNIIGIIDKIKGKLNKYINGCMPMSSNINSMLDKEQKPGQENNISSNNTFINSGISKVGNQKKFLTMTSNFSEYSHNSSNVFHKNCTNPFIDNEKQLGLYPNFNTMELQEDSRDLTHMKNLSKYMISLIGDFDFISKTDFKSLESKYVENKMIEISNFKLSKLIKNCLKIFETRAELNDKNLNFSYEIEEGISMMNSDYRRINQILLNLLSNSYKFTNSGEINIKIRKNPNDENLLYFSVKDSGTGFNTDILDYYNRQSSANISKNINRTILIGSKTNTSALNLSKFNNNNENNIYGMGLGLRIVKALVSILGENFEINSKERSGTTVTFSLYIDSSKKNPKDNKISFNFFDFKKKIRLNTKQISAFKKLHTSQGKNAVIQEIKNKDNSNSPVKNPITSWKKARTERKSISMVFKKGTLSEDSDYKDKDKNKDTKASKAAQAQPFNLVRSETLRSRLSRLSKLTGQDIISEKSSQDENNMSSTLLIQENPRFDMNEVNKLQISSFEENIGTTDMSLSERCKSKKNSTISQKSKFSIKSLNGGDVNSDNQNKTDEYYLFSHSNINNSEAILINNFESSQNEHQNGQDIQNQIVKQGINQSQNSSTNIVIQIFPEKSITSNRRRSSFSRQEFKEKITLNLSPKHINSNSPNYAKTFKDPHLSKQLTLINRNPSNLQAPTFNDINFPMNTITRILVVDDEKLIRQSEVKIIQKYFKKIEKQVEIIECSDGAECLYQLFKGSQSGIQFDYIITDETMNFMRGSLMAQTIKSLINDNVLYHLKIFMVTSYESSSIIERFGKIVDDIVTKPLTPQNIKKIFNM